MKYVLKIVENLMKEAPDYRAGYPNIPRMKCPYCKQDKLVGIEIQPKDGICFDCQGTEIEQPTVMKDQHNFKFN
jgi:hypothetical protein